MENQAQNPAANLTPMTILAELMVGCREYSTSEQREAYAARKCERANREPGTLTGYDCSVCLNRGYIWVPHGQDTAVQECKCMEIRRNSERLRRSGMQELVGTCTFDSYQVTQPWQAAAKQQAMDYVRGMGNGSWFYAGGQVGSGKTHLCAAIAGACLQSGLSSMYMLWRDETVRLKADILNAESYSERINALKRCGLLYIDDLFKIPGGNKPTSADINVTFELLNYRYLNRLPTVISSELTVDNIISIDEAIGSRIYERAKGYTLIIGRDRNKNWRLR